jgi:hypothetical protein
MSDMGERAQGSPTGDDPHLGSLLGGIAVGVVLLGAVWLLVATVGGGGLDKTQAPDPAPPSAAPAAGVPSPGAASPRSTRLQRCTAAARTVEGPLDEAQPALDQWGVHIGAMNKLVVGQITLQQATAFWNQTRVGAYDRIEHFEGAEARLRRRGVDCPAPRLLGSGASPALRACAQHVAAELGALDTARTAITTWDHHMHAMDQLRSGRLSPAAATRMWLSMWQSGVHELEAYRGAARAARRSGTCNGTTPQAASSPTTDPSSPASPAPTESPMPGMDMK